MANATNNKKRPTQSETFFAEYIGKFMALKLTSAQSYYYMKLISSDSFLVPHKRAINVATKKKKLRIN